MIDVPLEFVEWCGYQSAPLKEGELAAYDEVEMRFALARRDSLVVVQRWSRGSGPTEMGVFLHESDAIRHLVILIGSDGRGAHHLPRLRVPAQTPREGRAAVSASDSGVTVSWTIGGDAHQASFPRGVGGNNRARIFAQAADASLSDVVVALTAADGGQIFAIHEEASPTSS